MQTIHEKMELLTRDVGTARRGAGEPCGIGVVRFEEASKTWISEGGIPVGGCSLDVIISRFASLLPERGRAKYSFLKLGCRSKRMTSGANLPCPVCLWMHSFPCIHPRSVAHAQQSVLLLRSWSLGCPRLGPGGTPLSLSCARQEGCSARSESCA